MISKLYEQYHKGVYLYIYSLCHDQTLSEDLTSETFYQVMLSLPSFKYNSSIKTWIFAIARNTAYKELRKRKVEISLEELPEFSINNKLFNHDYDYMISLIDALPEREKIIIHMRMEGYSFDEIAEKINMNTNSARVLFHRTRQKIIRKLKKE